MDSTSSYGEVDMQESRTTAWAQEAPQETALPTSRGRWHNNLQKAITWARNALIEQQHSDGYWCYELEADCTIPAEYILLMHYMDDIDEALQAKMANYLRRHQESHGGWPLFHGGDFDLSCSVKVYYALKLAGDAPDQPHMVKARQAILAHGGAARCNVFTRITLALFQQIPWRGVPFIPVEIILLPDWFPFTVKKVSYWSRTVMVPLLILCSQKASARNPHAVNIRELFTTAPELESNYFPVRSPLNRAFLVLDRMGHHVIQPLIPRPLRRKALKKAEQWFVARLNGEAGLGAIFPAMVNAREALDCLGYPKDHPLCLAATQALKDLLVVGDDHAYCQPCVSPIWDTALACLTLQEDGHESGQQAAINALDWLQERQLQHEPGDWRENRPDLEGGGWAFQFRNDYYPDVDDTSVVALAMERANDERYSQSIEQAALWICGMQSRNGGFAAFDADNTYHYLNEIPFADHGALLDPPTSDVSARSVMFLTQVAERCEWCHPNIEHCLDYLREEQEEFGAWFGRWGTNYIYGTWSVLMALEQAQISVDHDMVQNAVQWLKRVQRHDGGWGESNGTYFHGRTHDHANNSTAFQTAWALLGLMAANEVHSTEVKKGIDYLLRTQQPDGFWQDREFTAPGFPRVFYLKYHGYSKYFPLWALVRYRNLITGNAQP
jgi:squalene-hopene/tetraprenyl-beta-curcumene cyclase